MKRINKIAREFTHTTHGADAWRRAVEASGIDADIDTAAGEIQRSHSLGRLPTLGKRR